MHQPNGAENEYYEGLDRPYSAKNADFDTVEELLLVRLERNGQYAERGLPENASAEPGTAVVLHQPGLGRRTRRMDVRRSWPLCPDVVRGLMRPDRHRH